jgi:hypothetical protein
MRHPSAAILVVALAIGCATTRPHEPEPAAVPAPRRATADAVDAALRDPKALFDHGKAALDARELDLAYRYFALVHQLHPASAEDVAAFPWACGIFKRFYEENRYAHPDSVWSSSEAVFLFDWLETFFAKQKQLPAAELRILSHGAPYPFGAQFLEHAKTRKAFAGWRFAIEDDNGRIVTINGERAR